MSDEAPRNNAEREKGSKEPAPFSSEELFQQIDFKVLSNILVEIQKKAGIHNPRELRAYDIELVEKTTYEEFAQNSKLNDSFGMIAWITPTSNKIRIDKNFIRYIIEHNERNQAYIQVLHALVHESLHFVSEAPPLIQGDSAYIHSGIETHFAPRDEGVENTYTVSARYHTGINEALTEQLSLEVLKEYMTRTGVSSYIDRNNSEDPIHSIGRNSYLAERIALDILVQLFSRHYEVEPALIFQGLIRQYMSKEETSMNLLANLSDVLAVIEREVEVSDEMRNLFMNAVTEGNYNPLPTSLGINWTHQFKGTNKEKADEFINGLETRINKWYSVDTILGAAKLR